LGRRISSIRRYQILLGEILSTLFPSAIAWVDFMFIWVFMLTMIYNAQIHEPIQTVIAGLGTLITKKVAKKIFSLLALGFLFPLFIDTIKFTKKNIIEMVASILTVGTIGILLPTVSCMLMRDNCIGIVIALLPILVLEIVYIILVGEQENEEEA